MLQLYELHLLLFIVTVGCTCWVKLFNEDFGLRTQIDQAALTGESLPAKKYSGNVAFSGSTVKQGEKECLVYATGENTFFGRAAALISGTHNVANLQKIMTRIGGTCLITIGIWCIIELAVQFGHYKHVCKLGEGARKYLPSLIAANVYLVKMNSLIASICL